jgi:hypothetical protein
MTDNDILEVYRSLEVGMTNQSVSVMENYSGYAFGSLATEYLIGLHDYDTFMNFLDSVGKGANWKTQFLKDFGQTPDAFYVDVLQYLKKIY